MLRWTQSVTLLFAHPKLTHLHTMNQYRTVIAAEGLPFMRGRKLISESKGMPANWEGEDEGVWTVERGVRPAI